MFTTYDFENIEIEDPTLHIDILTLASTVSLPTSVSLASEESSGGQKTREENEMQPKIH